MLDSVKWIKDGKIYKLGHNYESSMPLFGKRVFTLRIPGSPTGGPFGDNRLVYHDEFISVRAIPVLHGSWSQAFGYAIDAGGRTIVLSGDTAPCPAIADACHGCDVLVHEVYSALGFAQLSPELQRYHASFHTSSRELAAIAAKSKPKLLVLYHQIYFGTKVGVDLEKEIQQSYTGKVVSSKDLDVY